MFMEGGGVTNFELGRLFMHPVPRCCTMITNIFKHDRYSYRSNAFFLHTMPGYCYLTPGCDISILHPSPIALAQMLSYPTELHFYDNNYSKNQPIKLHHTTIICRIIDGTRRFNNSKIQSHALGSICVRRHWRS